MTLIHILALTLMACVASNAASANTSEITSVDITKDERAIGLTGSALRHIEGTIRGVVAADEAVVGLQAVAAGRQSVPYETTFEMTIPFDLARADGILVEATNRGSAIMANILSRQMRSGSQQQGDPQGRSKTEFLLEKGLSLASIQWQTGISVGVPEEAQGIGEVIVRDFGRLLAGDFRKARPVGLPVFRRRIIGGVSQSAWFVNSFIAEGFNTDPSSGRGVYQAAFLRNGNGVVLAINHFAEGNKQFPYMPPDRAPLSPAKLLRRPKSDPIVVDTSSFTDFYRVRASIFARAPAVRGLHRYASAAAHAPAGMASSAFVFGAMKCNGGMIVPLSPLSDSLYLRPLLLGLANSIGVDSGDVKLPADARFQLMPAKPQLQGIARLHGTLLWVPAMTAEGAVAGGIPLLGARLPLGTPMPPALSPVGVRSITQTCGNFSGWKAFTIEELKRRYGSRAAYLDRARKLAETNVAEGYLLAQDVSFAIEEVEALLPAGFN